MMQVISLGMSPMSWPWSALLASLAGDSSHTPSSVPGRLLRGPGLPFRVKTCRKDVPEAAAGEKDAPSSLGPTSWVSQGSSAHWDASWPPPQDGHGHICPDDLG